MATEDLADVLSEFARTMVTDFPIQGILDHLVQRIVEIMPVTGAGVTLISPGLNPRYCSASNDAALRFEKLQTDLGEGPCLAAYHAGEAISVPDLRSEERFPRFSPQALAAGMGAVFTFPLNHGDLRLGALDLYRDAPGPLSTDSMRSAQTLADVAAAYLINAQARSDLQDSSDQSRDAALHDPLTGLANRVLMLERLEHALLRRRRSEKTCAVFFVDLDRFKQVNDTYGHRMGDELLVAVAERLTGVLRPGDSLARLSGDEFVILCEDLDHPSQADTIAVRIGAEMGTPFALSRAEVSIAASIGIALTGGGNESPEDLVHGADLAMYRSKRHKRGIRHDLDVRDPHLAEHQAGLARSLRGALGRGEMRLEYEPIVDAVDGCLTGVEALLGWTHAGGAPVPPSVLMAFSEQPGHILETGRYVLEQVWQDRERWQRHRAENIAVSVNVSAYQFMAAGFADSVAAMLDRSSADPGLLTLEVSESYLDRDRDRDRVLIVLDELKELGVKLALDDFGAGHSSLSHLATIPIDEIKIDRSFIVDLGADPSSQVVVTAILQLAHGLGMTVVSEGVETAGQRRELIRLGCDFCQGSYFAQPMPASALDALIRKQAGESTPHLPSRTRVAKRGPAATDPSRSKQGDDSAAGPERPGLRT